MLVIAYKLHITLITSHSKKLQHYGHLQIAEISYKKSAPLRTGPI
ncbi:uncharacterized protein METZ01_LOCUS384161 [marine metagenome]|uniref:Uncharacterized protein n=1 Tax=marine metagenome TaxID=408172 RepID=A0A382UBC2_9ZZZZ